MPIKDEAAMNASLNNDYGATKGPNSPSSHSLALFVGDPQLEVADGGGYEISAISCPGYARVAISNDASWAPAADGMKQTAESVEFPAPTDEWVEEPTYWALIAPGEVIWDTGPLTEPMQITSASTEGILIRPVIFYSDAVTEEEE